MDEKELELLMNEVLKTPTQKTSSPPDQKPKPKLSLGKNRKFNVMNKEQFIAEFPVKCVPVTGKGIEGVQLVENDPLMSAQIEALKVLSFCKTLPRIELGSLFRGSWRKYNYKKVALNLEMKLQLRYWIRFKLVPEKLNVRSISFS